MNIPRYIYSWGNERNRREKPPRNRAAARRCVVVLFLLQKEREGEFQFPNWGFTIPLSECDGSNALPRFRCRCHHRRRPKESDTTMMMAAASLFSSKKLSRCISTHATFLIQYTTRRNRDSARPRVKATKSGPNRKRMRSPPG